MIAFGIREQRNSRAPSVKHDFVWQLDDATAQLLRIAEVLENVVHFHVGDDSVMGCTTYGALNSRSVGINPIRDLLATRFAAYPPSKQAIVEPLEGLSTFSGYLEVRDDGSMHRNFSLTGLPDS